MKSIPRSLFTAVGCLVILAVSARAQEYTRYRAKPTGSSVRIDGAANVHEWDMEGTLIGGFLDVPAGITLDTAQAAIGGAPDGKVMAKADVSIPVTSILNAKYEGMSEVMQQAMDAPNHPRIEYHLAEMTLKTPHAAGTPFQFDTKGELVINGVTNKVSFPVTIENVDVTKLKIKADAIPVNMPDYNVKPPVKMGLFVTEPGVKISFAWTVGMPAKK